MSTFAYTDQVGRDMMSELSSWSRCQSQQARHAAAAPSDDAWVTVRPAGQRQPALMMATPPVRPTEVAPTARHAQPVRYAQPVRSAQSLWDTRPARPAFVW